MPIGTRIWGVVGLAALAVGGKAIFHESGGLRIRGGHIGEHLRADNIHVAEYGGDRDVRIPERAKGAILPNNDKIYSDTVNVVSSMYNQADSNIIVALIRKKHLREDRRITENEIAMIINNEVKARIKNAVRQSKIDITIEALTGNLKIESSYYVHGIKLTGEVNIYKVSWILAGGISACTALDTTAFKDCVKAALAEVGSAVADEMKIKSRGGAHSTP